MAKVEDCPGFETFGADVKAAREAKRLTRKTLAEMVGIDWRYLANIENQGHEKHWQKWLGLTGGILPTLRIKVRFRACL